METFQITVPATDRDDGPGQMEIQADHWIDAWSQAVAALGGGPADPGAVDCTFADDGSIEVVDRTDGQRLVLRCVRVFRGREVTLESLTELCAAPSRHADGFAITRPDLVPSNQDSPTARERVLTPATEHARPALGWHALDLRRAETPDQAAELALLAFPCELVVFLRSEVDGGWAVTGAAGESAKRLRGGALAATSPIPPRSGALVGRRTFADDRRAIRFIRRLRSDTLVNVQSVVWTAVPLLGGEEPLRLMLINGPQASGFSDEDLSGVVSLARAFGAQWGKKS